MRQSQLIALDGFAFRAGVDLIEVEVALQNPSQFRHLQKRTLKNWGITYFTELPGTGAKTWSFRVQNPVGPKHLMQDLQAMRDHDEPPITEQQVTIKGIEVAIDAYHPSSDRLAPAVLHFLRHQAHPPARLPRITGFARCDEAMTPQGVLRDLLRGGITINAGEMGADHTCRYYVKNYDTVDGIAYAPLPAEQWRARFENTFRGDAVPFKTIEGWRIFRFETLAKDRFALLRPHRPATPMAALLHDRRVQLGFGPDSPTGRPDDRLKSWSFTRRDTATNEKFRMALRALTKLSK